MPGRTQRILCRAGFVVFCLLPTVAVGGWVVNARIIEGAASPVVEAQAKPIAEAELSRRLGLAVTLERIGFPQAGFTLLEGVTLADPETGQLIAFVPTLEMARTEAGLAIIATRPEIHADAWNALWEMLYERVLRERGERIAKTQFIARQVTFRSDRPGRSPTLTDVEVRLEPGRTAIDFRVAGVEMPNVAQFQATRDRTVSPPTTRWELHTGEAALPCVLFADDVPWLRRLGDASCFNGSLWAEETVAGWRGELTGRFTEIDLDRLVSDQFPHKLGGAAEATFSRITFDQGRVREASGWLEAGPGAVSRGLLAAALETFQLRATDRLFEAVLPLSRYSRLAMGFQVDESGLRISGNCDPDGALLVLESHPDAKVLDHPTQVTPIVSLVRMLAPASEVQVSATQETNALLRVLPLPPIKRPPPPASRAPEARVRFSTPHEH